MMSVRTKIAAMALAIAIGSTCFSPAFAQTYPNRPVTMVVPFPPGGNLDAATRLVANSLNQQFGQTFVIESKPGAATTIGAMAVARAKPDGYTLLSSGASTNIAPLLSDNTSFNPEDLVFVGLEYQTPWVLLVTPSFPAKNLAELIAYAKENPGKIRWATQGNGSVNRLVSERLFRTLDIKVVPVPYSGSSPAAMDVMGGRVDMSLDSGGAIMEQVQAGKLRALAISSQKRSARLPDVPTFRELGVDMTLEAWVGVFAPKGTPADVLEKLNKGINVATDTKEFQDWVMEAGGGTAKLSVSESQKLFEADRVMWRDIIKAMGQDAK